jgi:hypothetical protein
MSNYFLAMREIMINMFPPAEGNTEIRVGAVHDPPYSTGYAADA